MDSEPKTYRISPGGVDRLVWRRSVWVFVFFVVFIVVFVYMSGQTADQDQRLRLVVGGCFGIVSAFIGTLIGRKILQRHWSSYRLRFGEDNILRLREGLEPMRLDRKEITKVEEVRATGLTLRTSARLRSLFIPVDLAGYEEVRDIINQWQAPQTVTFLTWASRKGLQIGLALLYFTSWLISARSGNLAVVVPSALSSYGLLALALSDYQRSPNVTKGQKLFVWILLLVQWKFLALPYLRICSALVK